MQMRTYISLVIRYRFFILGFLLLVTGLAGANISRGVIASSISNLFLGESKEYHVYRDYVKEFGNDEVFIVAFEDPDMLSRGSLERLRGIIDQIRAIPEVWRVDSIDSAQHVFVSEDVLHIKRYAEEALAQPKLAGAIINELRADPLTGGLVISGDGRHTAVLVELRPDENRPMERPPRIVDEVLEIFRKAGVPREKLHRVGMLATISEMMDQSYFNISTLFPIVIAVIFLTIFVIFRRLWPVLIALACALMAVVWSIGFSVLIDKNINIFIAMVPAMILIVSTSDVIHLCSAYMLELAEGNSKEEAILKSASEVGAACLMTSVTTLIGFVSLSLIPAPIFRQLGLVLGFGVSVALIIAMTLSPILFSLMPRPKPWRTGLTAGVQGVLDRALLVVEKVSTGRPWSVVFLWAVLLGVMVFGLSRLHIETDLNKRFAEDNPIRIDEKYFEKHFVGSNFLEIFIEAPEDDGLLDPEVFARMTTFKESLEWVPEVDKAASLVDLIRIIHDGFNPGNRGNWPSSRELLAQYLLLFEMSGGEDLDRFIDFDRRKMRLAARLSDNRVRVTYRTGELAKEIAQTVLGDSVQVQVTGLAYLMGFWLDEIIAGQRRGLLFAFACIAFMMILGLRSIRVGLWSMIPNVIPLIALGGYVGLAWDQVDSDILAIAMIAIGIGVDNTIHFFMRLKFESGRAENSMVALRNTFHFSGRAIMITSIVLVLGFAPFALSDYFSMNMIGTFLPYTLVVALLADLLLGAALVKLGVVRFGKKEPEALPR